MWDLQQCLLPWQPRAQSVQCSWRLGGTHPAEGHGQGAQAAPNEPHKRELQESGTRWDTERSVDVQDKSRNGQCVLCLCLDTGFGFRSWVR